MYILEGLFRGFLIVLAETNKRHFRDAVNKAKELYAATVGKGKSELVSDGLWNIPEYLDYPENYYALSVKLCVQDPFYQKDDATQVERDFANYLETQINKIDWWYKNGENDAKHFAVPYDDKGTMRAFYPDWIVKYKDGKIGLFDTKSGITTEIAKAKAEGLYLYINEQNSTGKNLFGGIVTPKSGSWRYNDNEIYEYNKNDLKSWEFLP